MQAMVVEAAQHHQIVGFISAAVSPVDEVVNLDTGRSGAAGKLTVPVAGQHGSALSAPHDTDPGRHRD